MRFPLPKVEENPRYRLISLKDLYRPRPYKKPRAARRYYRRKAQRWARMTPQEQALYTFINDELRAALADEFNRLVLVREWD